MSGPTAVIRKTKIVIDTEHKYLPYLLAGVFILAALYIRPLMPIDETRYVAVAWEMWLRGDFLVPYLNGEPYSHKPPLFFWFMHLGWLLFGVNDWTPRLIAPLFSLLTLALMGRLARLLWPGREATAQLSQLILIGFYFWAISSTLTMFDVMLSFFVLLGVCQLYAMAVNGLRVRNWLLLAVAVAMGILSKGPVILLHLLFIVLSGPLWQRGLPKRITWAAWYGGAFGAMLLGIGFALCWALPAAIQGGEAYRQAILWGQTGGRIVKSFAHQLPWWWYLKLLPLLLLPWLLWLPLWRGLKQAEVKDSGLTFCLYWIVPVLLAFCVVSGKRVHYLLPLFPAASLLAARLVIPYSGEARVWRHSQRPLAAIVALLAIGGLVFLPLNKANDWLPLLQSLSPFWLWALLLAAGACFWRTAASLFQSVAMVSLLTAVSSLAIAGGYFQVASERHDVSDTGRLLAELQRRGEEIMYLGKYHGEYHFAGRLERRIQSIDSIAQWESEYPGTYLVVRFRHELPETSGNAIFRHADRGQNVAVIRHPSWSRNDGGN